MQERSIASEDWGGEVVTVPISALKGEGVEELLDMILLQAELMELKANPDAATEGVIVEARQGSRSWTNCHRYRTKRGL